MIYLDNHAAITAHARTLLTAHELRIIELETALQALLTASQEARATDAALAGLELADVSDAEFETMIDAAETAATNLLTAEANAARLCTIPQTQPTR